MKLSVEENKLIEKYWYEIDEYKRKLKFREWELFENTERDENIGGGKSNTIGNPTAAKAMKLLQDEKYQHYKRIIDSVMSVYADLDKEMQTIVHMRYWDKYDVNEWEDIATSLYMSRSKVLRKRNLILDRTAEKLGWL